MQFTGQFSGARAILSSHIRVKNCGYYHGPQIIAMLRPDDTHRKFTSGVHSRTMSSLFRIRASWQQRPTHRGL